jgi:glutamate racemase
MNSIKVVFTDSGLGGLTIMADFVKNAKLHGINVDAVFFNAQFSRDLGYKKMDDKTQIKVFNKVLDSIDKHYKPDIIAIACNTLSVVYPKTDFHKQTNTKVLDIINTGKSLINNSKSNTIVEIAMPTTIDAKIYADKNKVRIPVASNITLPDAIENGYQTKIDSILDEVFKEAKKQISNQTTVDMFLGCTHFPIIKNQFLEVAENFGIQISDLLNPNSKFSQLVLKEVIDKLKKDTLIDNSMSEIKVISRMRFQENEVRNIAALVENQSLETAEALRNYTFDTTIF